MTPCSPIAIVLTLMLLCFQNERKFISDFALRTFQENRSIMSPKSRKQYVFVKLIKIKTISLTSVATTFIGFIVSALIVTDQAWNSRILGVRLCRARDGNLSLRLEYKVNQISNMSSARPYFKRSLQMEVIYNVRNSCLEVLYKADAIHEEWAGREGSQCRFTSPKTFQQLGWQ